LISRTRERPADGAGSERGTVLTGHPSWKLFAGYFRRLLAPAQLLALDDHVAKCRLCRERLRAIAPARVSLTSLWARVQHAVEKHPAGEEEDS
jgi:hypothetical protein